MKRKFGGLVDFFYLRRLTKQEPSSYMEQPGPSLRGGHAIATFPPRIQASRLDDWVTG